jgi:hypothetical protein
MDAKFLQQQLFQQIRDALAPHLSLVSEVSAVLQISDDSTYRRIRGEKPLTFDELKLLCDHFQVSLDQTLQRPANAVVFQMPPEAKEPDFMAYLEGLLAQVQYFNRFQNRELFYLCKDAPIFHFYHFREVAAFKTFFWIKSILNHPDYAQRSFSLSSFDDAAYFKMGQKVLSEYNQLPSAELWNFESINSTINQLEYYRDAGIFDNDADYNTVLDSLEQMLQHMQRQAGQGQKFMSNGNGEAGGAPLKFYINEIILGNNSIMVELDGTKMAFVNYSVLNYLMTRDARFTQESFDHFRSLASRSALISGSGEKERTRYFKNLRERVAAVRRPQG